jgi:hypothetical protein
MKVLNQNIQMGFRYKCYIHLSVGIEEIIDLSVIVGKDKVLSAVGMSVVEHHGGSMTLGKTNIDKLIEQIAVEELDLIDQGFYIVPKSGRIKTISQCNDKILTMELSFEVSPEQCHGQVVHPMEGNLIPVGEQVWIQDTYEFIEAMRNGKRELVMGVEYNGYYYHVYAGNLVLTYDDKVYLLDGQKLN